MSNRNLHAPIEIPLRKENSPIGWNETHKEEKRKQQNANNVALCLICFVGSFDYVATFRSLCMVWCEPSTYNTWRSQLYSVFKTNIPLAFQRNGHGHATNNSVKILQAQNYWLLLWASPETFLIWSRSRYEMYVVAANAKPVAYENQRKSEEMLRLSTGAWYIEAARCHRASQRYNVSQSVGGGGGVAANDSGEWWG